MRGWLFGRRDVKGVDCFDPPPPGAAAPSAPAAMCAPPQDWSRPPSSRVERPNPTRVVNGLGVEMFPQTPIVAAPAGEPIRPPAALLDPPPAEVIPVLEMLDILKGPGGTFGRVSAKVRKRELDRIALEHMHAGEPFVYLGRRFPGANG
jgi:hypothetical protein